jgi:hypothetical protein
MLRTGAPDRTGKLFNDERDLGAIGHMAHLLGDRHATQQFFLNGEANPPT